VFGVLHVIIDVPPTLVETSTAFWSAALGCTVGEPWPEHPELCSLVPESGRPYVHLQTGDHGPRVHLDMEVVDPDAEASRLAALGGSARAAREATGDSAWHAMLSPAGFPCCLLPARPAVVPKSWRAPDGHRLRLVQVCLDMPRVQAPAETGFWRAASGWHWVPSADEAFLGKLHHGGASPVQLLLQRLGESDPAETVRAHIDLGTDDIEAAVHRLVRLGASRGLTGSGWVVLTDPVGMVFCVTENPPD
jgi:catechol 2,3-dioxygenase-like lactoylglutathione lyase family enzyme